MTELAAKDSEPSDMDMKDPESLIRNPFHRAANFARDRGSSLSQEVLGGFVIYLSMVYIFILNPEIIASAGTETDPISTNSILFATVIISAIATIAMGLVANLPLAVAPGLEISTFYTFVLVGSMGLTWRQALAAVLISGLLNVAMTVLSFRERIVESIPAGLRASLLLCVGVFIFMVGLKLGGLVDISQSNAFTKLLPLESLQQPVIMLLGALLCFTTGIDRFVLPWGIIFSVLICTALSWYLGVIPVSHPGQVAGGYFDGFLAFDFSRMLELKFISGMLILFVIDFIGGLGKIVALTTHTSIQSQDGTVPRLRNALAIDGAATVAGSMFGTSSMIAFVESRLGIEAGARTGIAAIVCGMLMFTGLLYSSVFLIVPPVATAGILLFVGILLIRANFVILGAAGVGQFDVAVGLIMAAAVALTFQMDWAMFIGFAAYFFRAVSDVKRRNKSVAWMGILAFILGLSVLLPMFRII